jgi:hypothetical protein
MSYRISYEDGEPIRGATLAQSGRKRSGLNAKRSSERANYSTAIITPSRSTTTLAKS